MQKEDCMFYLGEYRCSNRKNPDFPKCINKEYGCIVAKPLHKSKPQKIMEKKMIKENRSYTSSSCPTISISSTPSCSTCFKKVVYGTGSNNPLDKQIGGNHYKDFKIQPIEFFMANQTPYVEAAIIKYVLRHKMKGGKEDLKKAIHCCELLIKENYG